MPNNESATISLMATGKTIGERTIEAREALGLTQAEFSRRLGIKAPSMRAIESGKTKAPASTTLLRMKACGINPEYIMNGREPLLLAEIERTIDERTLLATFREMNSEQREAILGIVRQMRRRNPPGSTDPFGFDPPEGNT